LYALHRSDLRGILQQGDLPEAAKRVQKYATMVALRGYMQKIALLWRVGYHFSINDRQFVIEMREYRDKVIKQSREMRHASKMRAKSSKGEESKQRMSRRRRSTLSVSASANPLEKTKCLKLLALMVKHPTWVNQIDTGNATSIKVKKKKGGSWDLSSINEKKARPKMRFSTQDLEKALSNSESGKSADPAVMMKEKIRQESRVSVKADQVDALKQYVQTMQAKQADFSLQLQKNMDSFSANLQEQLDSFSNQVATQVSNALDPTKTK
jgi:hypothetical protein